MNQVLSDDEIKAIGGEAFGIDINFDGHLMHFARAIESAVLAKLADRLMQWQPIESAPKGRIVLVHYKNELGNGRTVRARYYLPETLDSDTTESGWADEGWYEESEAYEYLMPLDGVPTHWMPLPPAPEAMRG